MNVEISKVLELIGQIPNPYPEDVFVLSTGEAGALMRQRGLSSDEITGISGCLCRYGWDLAMRAVLGALEENDD